MHMVAIRGRFDGKVFIPDEPVDVPRDRPLILHVEVSSEPGKNGQGDLWDTLEQLTGTVDAPPDWSNEHDHYLYGTPKRNVNDGE
jgi:hypothetical protein